MTIYAINGSPRKTNNTATLLSEALAGAQAALPGVETELIHLYSYNFNGCVSCFECKRLGGKSYGHCALRDEASPLLDKLAQADGLIFGSPVYFHGITGKLRMFLERLFFPCLVYDADYSSLAPRRMPTAFIYTMNVPHEVMLAQKYPDAFRPMEFFLERLFSKPETLYANDTYQFSDYSKYKVECFSEAEKAHHRERQFPIDRRNAFELGQRLARRAG